MAEFAGEASFERADFFRKELTADMSQELNDKRLSATKALLESITSEQEPFKGVSIDPALCVKSTDSGTEIGIYLAREVTLDEVVISVPLDRLISMEMGMQVSISQRVRSRGLFLYIVVVPQSVLSGALESPICTFY